MERSVFLKMYFHIRKRRVSSGMDHNYKLLSFYILYPLYPSALCIHITVSTAISSQEGIILHWYCFKLIRLKQEIC